MEILYIPGIAGIGGIVSAGLIRLIVRSGIAREGLTMAVIPAIAVGVASFYLGKSGISFSGIVGIIVFGAAVIGSLYYGFSKKIVKPIENVVSAAKNITQGDFSTEFHFSGNNELGQISEAFREFHAYLNHIASTIKKLSEGNFSYQFEGNSGQDTVYRATESLKTALQELVNEINQIIESGKKGNFNTRLQPDRHSGEFGSIARGLNEILDSLAKPLNETTSIMQNLSNRDFTRKMTGTYSGDFEKMKNLINTTIENLEKNLSQVSLSASQVNSATNQINSSNQSIAQGASEQASSIQEISSSLQEMSSMTQQNTMNAKEARGLSEKANQTANDGLKSMRELSEVIERIKTSSDETAKIVKTIDDIAFQTNLLALNAAVEAARAGEAGKGFAVVAEEVRNLAMRSAEAAKNTTHLIEGSVRNAEDGVAVNKEVVIKLEGINEQVRKVNEVINEIAAASEQQAQGIGQVNTAVEQLNQVTQQNAASSEESASATSQLLNQANRLQQMLTVFKLNRKIVSPTGALPAKASPKNSQSILPKKPPSSPSKSAITVVDDKWDAKKVIPFDEDDDISMF